MGEASLPARTGRLKKSYSIIAHFEPQEKAGEKDAARETEKDQSPEAALGRASGGGCLREPEILGSAEIQGLPEIRGSAGIQGLPEIRIRLDRAGER